MLPKSKIERIFNEKLRDSCHNSPLETSPNCLPVAEEKCYFEFGKSLSFILLLIKTGIKAALVYRHITRLTGQVQYQYLDWLWFWWVWRYNKTSLKPCSEYVVWICSDQLGRIVKWPPLGGGPWHKQVKIHHFYSVKNSSFCITSINSAMKAGTSHTSPTILFMRK